MTHRDRKCEVCGEREANGSACSGLGPVSFLYCNECARDMREPAFMFEATYELIGEHVAPHVKALKTVLNGTVLTWEEWLAARGES